MDDLNFIPVDREIKLDVDKTMICKLTPDGVIDYVNDYFTEITGYEVHEVVGGTYENFIHKDVPKTIFNLAMGKMEARENFHIILKDQAKDGRHYWFITDIQYKTDAQGKITSIYSRRRATSRSAIPVIEKLYRKLYKMEQHASPEIASTYLEGFLEDKGMTFEEYIENIITKYEAPPTVTSSFESQGMKQSITTQKRPKKKLKKKKSIIDILFKK